MNGVPPEGDDGSQRGQGDEAASGCVEERVDHLWMVRSVSDLPAHALLRHRQGDDPPQLKGNCIGRRRPPGRQRSAAHPGPLLLYGRDGGGGLRVCLHGGLLALLGVCGGLAGDRLGAVEVGLGRGKELAALLLGDT